MKTVAGLQPLGAQPVPEQCSCTNLSPSLLLDMMTYGLEYPQVSWVHCPGCAHFQFFVHPPPAHWWSGWGEEKALSPCKHSPAELKTSFYCHQHLFSTSPKHSPVPGAVKKINSTTAPNSTWLQLITHSSCNNFFSMDLSCLQFIRLRLLVPPDGFWDLTQTH